VAVLVTRFFVFDSLGSAAAVGLQALLSIALTVGAVMTPMSGLYLVPLLNRQMPVAAKLGVANDFAAKIAFIFASGRRGLALPDLALTVLFSHHFAAAAGVLFLFVVWQCLHHLGERVPPAAHRARTTSGSMRCSIASPTPVRRSSSVRSSTRTGWEGPPSPCPSHP
jgi:hypothetical protein